MIPARVHLVLNDWLMVGYAVVNVGIAAALWLTHSALWAAPLPYAAGWAVLVSAAILGRSVGERIGYRRHRARIVAFDRALESWHRELHSV